MCGCVVPSLMVQWCCAQIQAHDDDVNTVIFADDSSQIIYSGGDDGLCKVSFMLYLLLG